MSVTTNSSVTGVNLGGVSSAFNALGSQSGAFNIDLSLGPNIAFTAGAAVIPSFTNTPALNTCLVIRVRITNGIAGVTFPAGSVWNGAGINGAQPTLTSGTENLACWIINNNGTLIYSWAYTGKDS
ncbi:MAG: hypothetical protein ACXWJZ_01440 [Burkholderiaceae bacterium]